MRQSPTANVGPAQRPPCYVRSPTPFLACTWFLRVAPVPAWALPPGFYPLGDLPGGSIQSVGYGVSADGSVGVGTSRSSAGFEAFRWTQATSMVSIGDLPGSGVSSSAHDVSADGLVIVGVGLGSSGEASFRWTAETGMIQIAPSGGANGVSADGSVVVGGSGSQAYRWTEATGAVGLADLPGGSFFSDAYDVSADGLVVVGHGESAFGTEAFRWTAQIGMVGLGDLPGGPFFSEARGVSADGSVVVGFSDSAFGQDAFRWTPETGMVSLGAQTTSALDVSADGTIILGSGGVPGGVFVWDEVHGLRSVQRMLGFDLSDWQALRPQGISDDGTTIIGWGNHADLQSSEAWIAVLPEPSTLALLTLGAIGALRRRRCDWGGPLHLPFTRKVKGP